MESLQQCKVRSSVEWGVRGGGRREVREGKGERMGGRRRGRRERGWEGGEGKGGRERGWEGGEGKGGRERERGGRGRGVIEELLESKNHLKRKYILHMQVRCVPRQSKSVNVVSCATGGSNQLESQGGIAILHNPYKTMCYLHGPCALCKDCISLSAASWLLRGEV